MPKCDNCLGELSECHLSTGREDPQLPFNLESRHDSARSITVKRTASGRPSADSVSKNGLVVHAWLDQRHLVRAPPPFCVPYLRPPLPLVIPLSSYHNNSITSTNNNLNPTSDITFKNNTANMSLSCKHLQSLSIISVFDNRRSDCAGVELVTSILTSHLDFINTNTIHRASS